MTTRTDLTERLDFRDIHEYDRLQRPPSASVGKLMDSSTYDMLRRWESVFGRDERHVDEREKVFGYYRDLKNVHICYGCGKLVREPWTGPCRQCTVEFETGHPFMSEIPETDHAKSDLFDSR